MAVGLESYQLRSFLFLCAVEYLLTENGFCGVRENPGEGIHTIKGVYKSMQGRSEWHDVDGVYDFQAPIPFTDTLRLCVQAKFFDKKLSKMHIREFIGIMKDVEEVYMNQNQDYARSLVRYRHQGVYFAMNGFTPEAQHLAWAHGIQTVSFADQALMEPLRKDIGEFARLAQEEITFQDQNEINAFFLAIRKAMLADQMQAHNAISFDLSASLYEILTRLYLALHELKTSAIATSRQGVYVFALSKQEFPLYHFVHTDQGMCQIHLEKRGRKKNYYFTVNKGMQRFYFTRPYFLNDSRLLGNRSSLQLSLFAQEQAHYENELQLCIRDQGIMRYLRLRIDPRLHIDS